MRLLNQIMLNLSRIFDCLSGRFNKAVFNLKLSNLVDTHLRHGRQYCLGYCAQRFAFSLTYSNTQFHTKKSLKLGLKQ